ncbi:LexA repressor [Calidithermus terrae]|uniref:LexA repressor n=2 Tax=Calidithermus terrae TaxID=1408545 RepID=A0A399ELQ4_9DEIN|nr:LexA repressor [Calidithermus terrae]
MIRPPRRARAYIVGPMKQEAKLNAKGWFGDWIEARMRELGMRNVEEFGRYAGINRSTMHQLVKGRTSPKGTEVKPSVDTLVRLAVALGRPIQDLIPRVAPRAPLGDPSPQAGGMVRVPVVSAVGGAGAQAPGGWVAVDERLAAGRELVAYRVCGDSMCAGRRPIGHGDLIAVDRRGHPAPGAVVVARLAGGAVVCRVFQDDHFGARLVSLNPLSLDVAPPVVPLGDVAEILGPVVLVQGEVGHLGSKPSEQPGVS